ncbi:MAG TPA: competence/damage-inducible protein A, partial [Gemmatimonadaceae bacterium]|nr:competence/damage-inducible protein A [Gemmatimonadaceae bacterium]
MNALQVELVTIGDELLLGFTIDTNAAHISRTLAAAGVEVVRRTTVGDDAKPIALAVSEALERTGAVITTGGLGPTSDDLTKPAIAKIFGRGMKFDEAIADALEQRWRARFPTSKFPVTNRTQAEIPEGARVLTNRHGTAPGIWLEDDRGRWVAMMPGVPREMRGMLSEELLPAIKALATGAENVVFSGTLRTTGIAESAISELLGPNFLGGAATELGSLPLAYLPGVAGVDLRVTAKGLQRPAAETLVHEAISKVRSRVGVYAYGEGEEDLAAVVLDKCRALGLKLAVAESCTGGLLGERITNIPGSSDVFLGGVIAYHNDVKCQELGVSVETLEKYGAVSEEVALQMASGIREKLGASVGVSVTGIAGPGGGTPQKPVGLVWIAVHAVEAKARRFHVVGDRTEIRQRAAQAALDMLRRAL